MMVLKIKKVVLFFSSLVHGGGRTFAESYAQSLQDADITLSTLYDNDFTKSLAQNLGLRCRNILDPRLLLDSRTLVLSNSQVCAAMASLLYPGRHYYVTHGYANGLPYAPVWRRLAWTIQVNTPGTRLIACGDSERDAIARLCLVKQRVSLIRNGIPLKVLEASPDDCRQQRPVAHFVYVGRITFQKGLDVLLNALEQPLLRQYDITLSIIGNYQESESEYCELVRSLIKVSSATVQMLPPQPINTTFFRNFSALISPSRFEGLPYTILEAAYAGIPIVLSDCPGNNDIAPDDRYAFTFRSGSDDELAQALFFLLQSDQADVERRAYVLQRRVAAEFSAKAFRDEYYKLLC
jgi:glycosyltransferase involved in cell wall biosynthesis